MNALHARLGRSTAPLAQAVAGAFEEVNARDRRQPLQLVDRERERSIDEPVDCERVHRRIDLRHARMMALEMERRGRDDAVGVVQRRPAGGFFEGHPGVGDEVARRGLEARPRSIGTDRRAERARLGAGCWSVGLTPARDEDRAPEGAGAQKPPSGPLHARLL